MNKVETNLLRWSLFYIDESRPVSQNEYTRIGKTQSFVIIIPISAYATIAGGATIQYDQKIVRLKSFSKASLDTACVICRGRNKFSD